MNKYIDIVLNGGIVRFEDRYYKYNIDEKMFYYADYSISNTWKKSKMTIDEFNNIDWIVVK